MYYLVKWSFGTKQDEMELVEANNEYEAEKKVRDEYFGISMNVEIIQCFSRIL